MSNHAISTARNVQEILQLNYIDNGYPKSLDNIIDIASQLSDKPIEYLEVQMFQEDSAVKGSCVISKDKYSILALAGLNPCWRRFVTCKEIMHALMDCDEYRNLNIDIHIEQSLYPTPEMPLSAMAEFMAESAAMELLFPVSQRSAIVKQKTIDYFAVATHYRIPRAYVQKYLSQAYMQYFEKLEASCQ